MVALTNTFKGTIKKTANLQKIRGQLLDIKKDHKQLTDAKSSLESLSKNFDHIDQCFPVNETARDGNSHIRRILKRFLHYESSGRMKAPADDPINHANRMKFVVFLADNNHKFIGWSDRESGMQCYEHLKVRFSSFSQDFLNQYLKKDQNDHVCGIEERVHHRTRFHSGAQFGSSHLTLLEHIAVCLGTLLSTPVSSQAIYTYNMWYNIYHSDRMVYIGKNG